MTPTQQKLIKRCIKKAKEDNMNKIETIKTLYLLLNFNAMNENVSFKKVKSFVEIYW